MADAAVLARSPLPEQPDDDMQQVSSVLLQSCRQVTSLLTTQRQAELHHLLAPSAGGMLNGLESSLTNDIKCSSGCCIQPINHSTGSTPVSTVFMSTCHCHWCHSVILVTN